jgi:hypothetical protein
MKGTDNINFIFQFNNKESSASYFVLYIASGVVFLAAICLFIFTSMYQSLIATIVVGMLYFILFQYIKPTYFEFLVTETELQVNYYSVATTLKSYQSVLIPLNQLKGFDIKKSMFEMQKNLILTVESKFGLADYPPISVSILKKGELNQVLIVLSKILDTKFKS